MTNKEHKARIAQQITEYIMDSKQLECEIKSGFNKLHSLGELVPLMKANGTATITIYINGGAQDYHTRAWESDKGQIKFIPYPEVFDNGVRFEAEVVTEASSYNGLIKVTLIDTFNSDDLIPAAAKALDITTFHPGVTCVVYVNSDNAMRIKRWGAAYDVGRG